MSPAEASLTIEKLHEAFFSIREHYNKCADQTAGMHRLVWAFVVGMQQCQVFS